MAGGLPRRHPFALRSSPNNIVGVYDYGDGWASILLSASPDRSEDYYSEGQCLQIYVDGEWITAMLTQWDHTVPLMIDSAFDATVLVGCPWRLISPLTTWTVSGDALAPISGVVETMPDGLRRDIGDK